MTALSRCDKLAALYADLLGDLPIVDRQNQYNIVCEGHTGLPPSDKSLTPFYQCFDRVRQIMAKRPCGGEFSEWLQAYLKFLADENEASDAAAEKETGPEQGGEWIVRWDALEPWMQADVKERLTLFVPALEGSRAMVLLDRTCPCEYFKKSWGRHFHMVVVHDLTEAEAGELKAQLAEIPTKPDALGHFVWTLDWRIRTSDMTHEWLTAFGIEIPWRAMFGKMPEQPPKAEAPVFKPVDCRCTFATAEVVGV